jgi:glycosyltransferase involved in cell wall biosynthesis
MKILLIAPASIPVPPLTYGGIERMVYLLAKGLASRGHDVALAATADSHPPEGVAFIPTVASGNLEGERRALDYYKGRLGDFDLVSDHSLSKVVSESPLRSGAVYVPTCHTLTLPNGGLGLANLTCVSRAHARELESRYGCKPRIVYNGIDVERYPLPKKMDSRNGRMAFVGRLTPEKGALEAVRVCKRLGVPLDLIEGKGEEGRAMRLMRALALGGVPTERLADWFYSGPLGISELLLTLREARGGRCRYLANVSEEVKNELIASASGFIFPVKYEEPFGISVVEAMACGTPPVAYDRGAMGELIDTGRTGILVEPGDTAGLAKAIPELAGIDPDACRRQVAEKFSADAMVEGYVSAFKDAERGRTW